MSPRKKEEKMKVYRINWYQHRGSSFVEANTAEEAQRKAEEAQDFGWEEADEFFDDFDLHPKVCPKDETADFEPREIEDMKKASGPYVLPGGENTRRDE